MREFDDTESRLVAFEWDLVTEIIFGYRMEPRNIARIMQYAYCWSGTSETTPDLFQFKPARNKWKFEKKRRTVSLCEKCKGDGYLMSSDD